MIIRSIRLHAFRAHQDTRVAFAPEVNLLFGPNGAGKTNVLEAIHYLCLTKSFLASQDAYAVRKGAPFFELEGTFEGSRRTELKVRIAFVPEEGKRIFVNGSPLERLADLVGVLPAVVFSPDDYVLTAGGPDERRRLLNNILSQSRAVYLDDLMQYRRALRQRNELLGHARRIRRPAPAEVLQAWDAELVDLGSRIVAARLRFLDVFRRHLGVAYAHIASVAERPSIRYASIAPLDAGDDEASIADKFRRQLGRVAQRERERGQTLIGPHRDELVFFLDDFEVRRFASQGQHRTFGMALKLAQYFYLQEALEEDPILLLDDVFDHLDERRTAAFLALIRSNAVRQSVLTATRVAPFAGTIPFDAPEHRALFVRGGNVSEPEGVGIGEGQM